MQREATAQWGPIEAERKEDARLAALTADQQKEEEENGPPTVLRSTPNVKCIKCGGTKVLDPTKLALLEARGLTGKKTGNGVRRYPVCNKYYAKKKCQGALRVILAARFETTSQFEI
jgi:hypothetical protein